MSQMIEEKAARRSAIDISSAMPTSCCWNTSRLMGSMLLGMIGLTADERRRGTIKPRLPSAVMPGLGPGIHATNPLDLRLQDGSPGQSLSSGRPKGRTRGPGDDIEGD